MKIKNDEGTSTYLNTILCIFRNNGSKFTLICIILFCLNKNGVNSKVVCFHSVLLKSRIF